MDKLDKAIEQQYGNFKKWMNDRGVTFSFNKLVYEIALFGELYAAFSKEKETMTTFNQTVHGMPVEVLEGIVKKKHEYNKTVAEKIQEQDKATAKQPLIMPK